MGRTRKKSRWKKWLLIILLTLVCIGGAELLVCRMADPVLYERITAPVHAGISQVSQTLSAWRQSIQRPEPEPEPEPEPPEEQYAGDPAVWTDLSGQDRTITTLEKREEAEILTGGTIEIVYFNQADDQWKDLPYGSDRIGGYGCGPSVMAMAVSSLGAELKTPGDMAAWARENGHWARGRGSYLSIVEGAAAAHGLYAEPCRIFEPEQLRRELASGKLMVALMTKGHFTQGGHFILLRGATLEGDILVADPSSRDRSLVAWDAQLLLDELSASRNDGAPLWTLTTEEFSATIK